MTSFFSGLRGRPGSTPNGHGSHELQVGSEGSDRRDIKKNLIHCAVLKKLSKGFVSETAKKKFFVLYEDSRQSLSNPKAHTESDDDDDEPFEPARLEYYDTKRNWEAGEEPSKVVILPNVLTITQMPESKDSQYKHVIAIYMTESSLKIVFENDKEQELKTWLEMLLSCQLGGRSIEGRIPKPKYEHIYEVDIQHFEADLSSNQFQISGKYRMVVTDKDVKFFRVGASADEEPLCVLNTSIRSWTPGSWLKGFKLKIGRSSESGSGALVMRFEDDEKAASFEKILYSMNAGTINTSNLPNLPRSHRSSRNNRSIPFNSNNIRNRTHSWSNVDKKSYGGSLASSLSSAKPSVIHHQRQYSAAIIDRHRTTSEGTAHFEISKRTARGNKSLTSGSPMSPGSFVSSESAGSSNSLDDTENTHRYGMVTPIDDHVAPATIFEESSAESCVEQTPNRTMIFKQPVASESRLAMDNEVTQDSTVNYTPIDIISSAGYTPGTNSGHNIASSPPGSATHYTTIMTTSGRGLVSSIDEDVAVSNVPTLEANNDYMLMSPSSSQLPMGSKRSTATDHLSQPKHKPLSGLLDEIASAEGQENNINNNNNSSASNVTSPNSQSSYNPLFDYDNCITEGDSNNDYAIMSPATSSSGGGSRMGTGPRNGVSHKRTGSNSFKSSASDYVDMSSPRTFSGVVNIPGRNERTSSLGYSPSAALTSHLTSASSNKTPSGSSDTESPYLVMSPVDPDKVSTSDFRTGNSSRATPPVKMRTASFDSTGARPKNSGGKGRFYRGQSDSQRSSLCFDEQWDFGISPQESSGGTLMGPPSEAEDLDYVPLQMHKSSSLTKAQLDSLQPVTAISRLRLEDDISATGHDIDLELVSSTNARAYSVGSRPPMTGSNSSVSTTGSGTVASRHKSRFIDIPGAATASGTSGTGTGSHSSSISPGGALLGHAHSPSVMASRFGQWIRGHRVRSDSVPSKSAVNGRRRHRTQSEGEKDELCN